MLVERQRTFTCVETQSRASDYVGIRALRHWGKVDDLLPQALEFFRRLQRFVSVRSDGEQRDQRRIVLAEQLPQQRHENMRLVRPFGEKKLLALIDGQNESR